MLLGTPTADLGWQAAPFNLKDSGGEVFSLDGLKGENGTMVAFICNHCPYVQAIIGRLVADANVLQDEGINVVAINSNDYRYVPADSPPMMRSFAAHHNFNFPYLVDEDQSVGKTYGAVWHTVTSSASTQTASCSTAVDWMMPVWAIPAIAPRNCWMPCVRSQRQARARPSRYRASAAQSSGTRRLTA